MFRSTTKVTSSPGRIRRRVASAAWPTEMRSRLSSNASASNSETRVPAAAFASICSMLSVMDDQGVSSKRKSQIPLKGSNGSRDKLQLRRRRDSADLSCPPIELLQAAAVFISEVIAQFGEI